MMSTGQMPAGLAVRVLRAKAAELENWLQGEALHTSLHYLAADVGLVAGLLAEHIERTEET
jgi:hypothetical protein